jgi:hypothetical protein
MITTKTDGPEAQVWYIPYYDRMTTEPVRIHAESSMGVVPTDWCIDPGCTD